MKLDGTEKVKMSFFIDKDLHKKVKMEALKQDKTMQELVVELLAETYGNKEV